MPDDRVKREADDTPESDRMAERKEQQSDQPLKSVRIPGRDFAGTSYAANEEEQTRDARGENRSSLFDDVGTSDNAGDRPRDES